MLRLFVTLPFLVILIIFTIYNQEVVTLSGPNGFSRQFSLAVLVMIVAVVFFLIGGLTVWFAELRQRRRARRAEQSVRGLEAEVADLRQQLAQAIGQTHLAQQGAPYQGSGQAPSQMQQPYALQAPLPPSAM